MQAFVAAMDWFRDAWHALAVMLNMALYQPYSRDYSYMAIILLL